MTYKLQDRNVTVTEHLSSYLFFMSFKLDNEKRIELLEDGCYVAVLLDGAANSKTPADVGGGEADGSYNLTVVHKSRGEIKFSDLNFLRSIRLRRNNEWAELRLYQGCGNDDVLGRNRPEWVDTTGWKMKQHSSSHDLKNQWQRTFEFAPITSAPLDQSVVVWNKTGQPTSVTVIRRLIEGGSLSNIMRTGGTLSASEGGEMPELTLHCGDAGGAPKLPEEKFLTDRNVSSRRGFTMIAAGAFASQDADTLVDRWNSVVDSNILEHLREIAWAPKNAAQEESGNKGKSWLRKLYGAHNTEKRGTFAGTGINDDPVEVLHVESDTNDSVA